MRSVLRLFPGCILALAVGLSSAAALAGEGDDDAAPAPAGGDETAPGSAHGMSMPRLDEIKDAHGGVSPPHSIQPTKGRTDLTPAREELFKAMVPRDGAPPCSETDKLADAPAADYTWLVDHIAMPGWVPLRAADCLITGHDTDPEVQMSFLRWVVDPGSKGVGFLLLDRIDELPVDLAVKLATRAVTEGPDPKAAKDRVKKSKNGDVRKAGKG